MNSSKYSEAIKIMNRDKPKIRFKEFEEAWSKKKFEQLYKRVTEKNDLSFSKEHIISVANMYYNKDATIRDKEYLKTYNIFRLGDIAFEGHPNKSFSYGRFVENTIGDGIVSHVFVVYRPIMTYDLMYWKYAINNEALMKKVLISSTKASRMMHDIVHDDFIKQNFLVPPFAEQEKIGKLFERIDHLLNLQQRKCDKLKDIKKSMLTKMFPKPGKKVPEVRFEGFTDDWVECKLGEIANRITRKNTENKSNLPLTISAEIGLVDQITYFNNRVASKDVRNYYLVLNGEFAYNRSTSDGYPWGAIKRLDNYDMGVLSTLYIIFDIKPSCINIVCSDYLATLFETNIWHKHISLSAAEGARNHGLLNISADDFFSITISIPKLFSEQKQIGDFFHKLDSLIRLSDLKLSKLRLLKRSLLDGMFV